jgi:hypothetical protein
VRQRGPPIRRQGSRPFLDERADARVQIAARGRLARIGEQALPQVGGEAVEWLHT